MRPERPERPPTLEMRSISKTFPGVKALGNVQLKAWPGEVLALMGENGAGKSTLMKILSGAYIADAGGEILIDEKPVRMGDPIAAKHQGIAIIYQELSLAPNLTVAENIYLGVELANRGVVDRKAMADGCRDVLERLGAPFDPYTIVGTLSIAEQQLVEIARALHTHAKILVMDEPTTALSSRETEKLFALVKQLRTEGIAIIYISHRMAEVYELADRVSVLRDGTYVGTLVGDEINADSLVRMMVGRELKGFYKHDHSTEAALHSEVVLEVRDMADDDMVKGCSFNLHRGEVLGLAGLVGSGRTELARLIYGADPKTRGQVILDGVPRSFATPKDAIEAGVAYLTEDRKAQGLFLDMSVKENVNLGVIDRDAHRFGVLNLPQAARRVAKAIESLAIRVASPLVEVGSLSGGNQQKVLLSRWLETNPRVLILDEPTRGVDVGAKQEIYRIIDNLAKAGVAILMISSEMPEVMGIADRILVMREGVIEGQVGGDTGYPITQENIMALASGVGLKAA
jgi:ribose transport system ATP-binding protein